jgi:hypothetical protein
MSKATEMVEDSMQPSEMQALVGNQYATDGERFGDPTLLTADETATRLKVARSWVYDHADDLGAFHLGKYVRFSWPDVLERLRATRPN